MKAYTRNPQSIEETQTNKFISMREIENRRDKLASKNRRPEFVEKLDQLLSVIDKVEKLDQVLIIVDELDIENTIAKYS